MKKSINYFYLNRVEKKNEQGKIFLSILATLTLVMLVFNFSWLNAGVLISILLVYSLLNIKGDMITKKKRRIENMVAHYNVSIIYLKPDIRRVLWETRIKGLEKKSFNKKDFQNLLNNNQKLLEDIGKFLILLRDEEESKLYKVSIHEDGYELEEINDFENFPEEVLLRKI